MSDRPFSRKLIRPAFRLLRGGQRAHWEESWPHLGLTRPGAGGQITWKGRVIARLSPLAELHRLLGDRVAIVGSGPSLRDQRMGGLDMPAVLLNGAIAMAPHLPRPVALAIEDERFVFRHMDMLGNLPSAMPCLLSPSVLRVLAERAPCLLKNRSLFLIDDLRKPFDGPKRAMTGLPGVETEGPAAFSTQPETGIAKCGTVAYSALQIVMAGPVKRVLLAGVDLKNADQPRFYEAAGQGAWSGLSKGQERILAHFALARHVARARGQVLACASPVSALLDLGYEGDDILQPCERTA